MMDNRQTHFAGYPFNFMRQDMVEIRTGVIRPVECMKEGFEIIKSDYWILFAITLVGAMLGGITMYVLFGAMLCGIYYCYLQKIDGQPVVFEDLWKGFQWWLPGLVAVLIIIIPAFALSFIIYLPFIAAVIMGPKLSEPEIMTLLFGGFAVDIVLTIIMVCFHTLLMFTFPLIVDRNLGVLEAMKLSAKGVWKNLGGIAGLYGVVLILSILGLLTCIGTYFIIPIILAGTAVAYRKIYPKPGAHGFQPPSQNFQGI